MPRIAPKIGSTIEVRAVGPIRSSALTSMETHASAAISEAPRITPIQSSAMRA
jgi:hypothetical protein